MFSREEISEAEGLDDSGFQTQIYQSKEDRQDSLDEFKDVNEGEYKSIYNKNKKIKTGAEIQCPVCKKRLIKKSYQHAFCRSKGPGNCKDKYWNIIDDYKFAVLRNNFTEGD